MKKLIVGLLAAALMSLGLVGGAVAPSHATTCPYTGCVPTKPAHKVVWTHKGKPPKVRIKAQSGTAKPYGKSWVTCYNGRSVAKERRTHVHGGRVNMPTLRKKGWWTCRVFFDGKGVYKNKRFTVKVRVR